MDKPALSIAQKGWIEFDSETRSFKIIPVVQEIVRIQNHEMLYEHCKFMIDSLVEQLVYEPGTGHIINTNYNQAAKLALYAEMICKYLHTKKENISILLERIGNFYKTYGNLDKALKYFEDNIKLTKELYDSNPQNVGFKNGLAISYSKLGVFYRDQKNDMKTSRLLFLEAQKIWKYLTDKFPAYAEFQKNLKMVEKDLEPLKG